MTRALFMIDGKTWEATGYLIAMPSGPESVDGYVYRGLGLDKNSPGCWTLTHLGTGHRICLIDDLLENAFRIGTEFADCADWSFNSLLGWKNEQPDLAEKVAALCERHDQCSLQGTRHLEDAARQIAEAAS